MQTDGREETFAILRLRLGNFDRDVNSIIWFSVRIPLLTYTMVQRLSWAANWFAASQKIPRISRNPKVRYRAHKRPPPVCILGQPNPVHIPTSHLWIPLYFILCNEKYLLFTVTHPHFFLNFFRTSAAYRLHILLFQIPVLPIEKL